jgi:hypothetical protein
VNGENQKAIAIFGKAEVAEVVAKFAFRKLGRSFQIVESDFAGAVANGRIVTAKSAEQSAGKSGPGRAGAERCFSSWGLSSARQEKRGPARPNEVETGAEETDEIWAAGLSLG